MSQKSSTAVVVPPKPEIQRASRWNAVWFVPLVALFLGMWLLYRHFSESGPVACVRFETAAGILPMKTEVRCRSVPVGVVKHVKLAEDLNSVEVKLELNQEVESLLREGTRFWVVKPRLSVTEVSGVDTLISGSYIEMDPGPMGGEMTRNFEGEEKPPTTSTNVPGLRLLLTADEAGFLSLGSPVYYRGFEVGKIDGLQLNRDGKRVVYNAFIEKNYQHLVQKHTRFWNTSGIDISAGSDGFKVRTPSFQAMVGGGVCFGNMEEVKEAQGVDDGDEFELYKSEEAARAANFKPNFRVLLMFDQSVRGLSRGSTVEFRGVTVGKVEEISFDLKPSALDARIPVLVAIDPALMRSEVGKTELGDDLSFMKLAVYKGLRASLKMGSLITGAMYVELDYYKDSSGGELEMSGELPMLPTVSGGLVQLEAKVTAILDKLQSLPVEETMKDFSAVAKETKVAVESAQASIQEIQAASAAARKLLENKELQGLPKEVSQTLKKVESLAASVGPDGAVQGDLLRTLDELRAALRAIKSATNQFEEKPNSLIFGRESSGNLQPKAPRGGQ